VNAPAVQPAPVRLRRHAPRLLLPVVLTGALLLAIFATMVVRFRTQLREEIRQTIIGRDAAALRPVALRQLARQPAAQPADLLAAVLESAQQENMLAVAVFDADGRTLRFAPASLLFAELPLDDYLRLLTGEPISRYHADFPLDRYFSGARHAAGTATPVLEVLLPLHGSDSARILGFAQYYIDARPLAVELAAIDGRVNRQTLATLAIGAALIAAVFAAAYGALRRAQRIIAERNERLVRAHFELSLAAKASALGQIASHLVHGLQGSVAGLRAVVADREAGRASAAEDWKTAADYTERMQAMIQETVALLGDAATSTAYELTGHELAAIVRQRNAPAAKAKGVALTVTGGFDHGLDSHRGGLLCLIASNLVQNAIEATPPLRTVAVIFRNGGAHVTMLVSDEGPGIPAEIAAQLFTPGRSGRPGGTGLGLAISRLLARQIGATLELDSTGPEGTTFRLTLPVDAAGSGT